MNSLQPALPSIAEWYVAPFTIVSYHQHRLRLWHWAAAIRTVPQDPLKLVSDFASLKTEWVAQLDTLIAVIKPHLALTGVSPCAPDPGTRADWVRTEGMVKIIHERPGLSLKPPRRRVRPSQPSACIVLLNWSSLLLPRRPKLSTMASEHRRAY